MDENKKDAIKKTVDEAWKDTVTKEKLGNPAPSEELPEVTFNLFVTGLMMEALVALGEAENPLTKKKELNELHARFVIDTLSMLQEKTKSNLIKDESDLLEAMIYDLRMKYIEKTKDK